MGQQQLLLIVVGVVIVGLAVVLGFNMFKDAAVAGKVDGAISYTQNLGREAAASLQRGESFGGYASLADWVADAPSLSYTAVGLLNNITETTIDSEITASWTIEDNAYNIRVNVGTGAITADPQN